MDWTNIIGTSIGATILTSFVNIFINESKVNAEIKSKPRMEWIKEVRKLSVDLVYDFTVVESIMYNISNRYNDDELKIKLDNAFLSCNAKMNQLMIYFSYNDIDKIQSNLNLVSEVVNFENVNESLEEAHEKNKEVINRLKYDKNNDDKNDFIALFINQLLFFLLEMNKFEKEDVDYIKNLVNDNNELEDYLYKDNNKNDTLDKVIKIGKNDIRQKNVHTFKRHLDELLNIVSIYLKIEWDKAKQGE